MIKSILIAGGNRVKEINADFEQYARIRKVKSFYRAVEPQVETFQSGNMYVSCHCFKKEKVKMDLVECTPLPYKLYYVMIFNREAY